MATKKSHCSLKYHKFSFPDLETFAHHVSACTYSHNPPFTAPPLIQTLFDGLITIYHSTYEAYKNGGADQKADFTTAYGNLIVALDSLAAYVDGLAGLDEDMIALAGYTPTKTGETAAVIPPAPINIQLKQGATGEIKAQCGAIPGYITYGAFLTAGKPLPEGFSITNAGQIIVLNSVPDTNALQADAGLTILDLTKSRKKRFSGLAKGVEYFVYFYAINTAGVSQLSAVQSIVCG